MIWPSINTGLTPAEHDFFNVVRFVQGSYRVRRRELGELAGEPFWRWFARAGRRIVIADVPFARPEAQDGGRQFWGWCQHDQNGEPASVPGELLPDLARRFGAHPVRSCFSVGKDAAALARFRAGLLAGIRQRTELLCALAGERDWDLFYAGYCESHCAGHVAWHLNDESHPEHRREERASVGNIVLDVYSALDAGLGRLLRVAGPQTTCAILFSHGMGPNYHGDHLFEELLGRFDRARSGAPAEVAGAAPPVVPAPIERIWQSTVGRMPPAWRDRIKRRLPLSVRIGISLGRAQDPSAWARSLCFALPMRDGFSAVRVNLVGREPQGRIHPGQAYRDHLDALEAVLLRLSNAETGGRAVERLMRADRIVDPLSLGSGADLTVWWSKSAPLRAVLSPDLGTVTAPWTDDRSGEHVMRGMLLLSHPGASPGQRRIDGLQAPDIAPTLCELGGVVPGVPFSGRSRLSELLTAADVPAWP
jgi:predicted AlkP superfamily phosphohydrolase/phosphomutase